MEYPDVSYSYSYSSFYYSSNSNFTNGFEGETGVHAILVPIIFGIITVVGLIGNGCVVIVIARNRCMRTVTNFFIMNNAITDMVFVVICAPVTASQFILTDWIFGDFICKLVVFMQYVSVQASCSTIMAMTIDRYMVILHPMRSLHARTIRRTTCINIVIWLTSFLLHVPVAIYYEQVSEPNNGYFCGTNFVNITASKIYHFYAVIVLYVFPFLVMTFCYLRILRKVWSKYLIVTSSTQTQRKRRWKITRMTLLVVILFGICWGPIHAVHLVALFKTATSATEIDWSYYNFSIFCLCISYSNSAINPFVYAFSGRSYRSLLLSCLKRKPGKNPVSRMCSSRTKAGSAQYSLEMNNLIRTNGQNGRSPKTRYTNQYIGGGRHIVRAVPE
uniref:Kisspeptin-type receptor 9 n=2 Tax=Asterias rubens TaxID=7604 RepID=A0A8E6HPQ5_ASTRU|nr:kisspeptin-type receptor 9 [Asterias rubens]